MNRIIYILTLLTLQYYINAQTIIEGHIEDMDESWKPMLYLIHAERYTDIFSGYDGFVIDSAAIDVNGRFYFHPRIYKTGFYRLNIQPAGSNVKAGMHVGVPFENYIHLYINSDDKKVSVTARAPALTRYAEVKGNNENALFRYIREAREPFLSAIDSNWMIMKAVEKGPEEQLVQVRQQVVAHVMASARTMQHSLKHFIDTTTNLHAGILATTFYNLGDNYEQYAVYFDSLVRKWQRWDADNPYLAGLKGEVDNFNHFIPIGSVAPDIRLPNPKGDTLALSEIKAKLILVDFWASWCGPCREENRNTVRPTYARFKEKGFEVFGISFDTKRDKWRQAIEKDNYLWMHVIDTAGTNASAIGRVYKIAGIPTTYLLDENGVVLAKNLRGSQLTEFVESFFSEKK